MAQLALTVQAREAGTKGQKKELRSDGIVPGVVYGQGKKPQMVQVTERSIRKVFKDAGSEHFLLSLTIEKGDKKGIKKTVIVKDIQRDHVRHHWMHVDFQEISLAEKLRTSVEVVPVGTAVGVAQQGGTMERVMREVEVECLPSDIPERIEVDVAALGIGQSVHVQDLQVPGKVKILNDPELTVISVVASQEELEAVKPEDQEAAEPEVITEKKPEEGEAGAEGEQTEGKEAPKESKKESKKEGKKEGKKEEK